MCIICVYIYIYSQVRSDFASFRSLEDMVWTWLFCSLKNWKKFPHCFVYLMFFFIFLQIVWQQRSGVAQSINDEMTPDSKHDAGFLSQSLKMTYGGIMVESCDVIPRGSWTMGIPLDAPG